MGNEIVGDCGPQFPSLSHIKDPWRGKVYFKAVEVYT